MKRIFAVFLICILLMSLVSGCIGSESNETDEIVLDVYDQSATFAGEMTGWFADVIYNKFKVKLNFVAASDEAFTSMVEAGDLGDLIIFSNVASYRTAQEGGVLYNWDKNDFATKYASYITENLADPIAKNRALNADEGLYGISGGLSKTTTGYDSFTDVSYIRWDLYAELGYPEIQTLEDLESVLQDMVTLAQTTSSSTVYALSTFPTWDSTMLDLVAGTAGLYGYEAWGVGLYNPETKDYQECIDSDGLYIRILKFYNDLYQMGLIDPDSASQSYTTAQKVYKKGNAVFGLYDYITASQFNTESNLAQGKSMMPIVADDFKNITTQTSIYGNDTYWSVGAKSVYPDIVMEIIDWLYTPEGVLTANIGPQGICWDYDANQIPYLTDFYYEVLDNPQTAMPEGYTDNYMNGVSPLNITTWSSSSLMPDSDSVAFDYMSWDSTKSSQWYQDSHKNYITIESDWNTYVNASSTDEYITNNGYTLMPVSLYTVNEVPADIVIYKSQVASSIKDYSWLAIYATSDEEFDSIIKEMQDDIHSRKYEPVLEFYQDELKNFEASVN